MRRHIQQLIITNTSNCEEINTANMNGCICEHLYKHSNPIIKLEDEKKEDVSMVDIFSNVAMKCDRRLPQVGDVYKHFKGMEVYIVALSVHTETNEPLVVYKHGDDIWARPLEMFLSKVDKEKYPNVTQEYRLERELPLNVKDSIEFKELVSELAHIDRFGDMDLPILEDYVLKHYYL